MVIFMKLSVSHLQYLCHNLSDKLIGTKILRVLEYSKTDYFLTTSYSKKEKLVISLHAGHPFVTFAEAEDGISTLSSPFFLQLRKELDHATIEGIEVWNQDRILAFSLETISETFQVHKRYLVIELMTGSANMFLLTEEKEILLVYRPTHLQGKRILIKGMPYEFPLKNEKWTASIEETPWDLQDLFYGYQIEQREKRKKDKHERLLRTIRTHLKSALKKLKKQEIDLQLAEEKKDWREKGDVLFTYLDEISSNQKEVTLDGMTIALDPTLSIKENAILYYQKYQKSRNALVHLQEQIQKTKDDIAYFSLLEEQWKNASDRDLMEMEEELSSLGLLPALKQKKHKEKKSYEPYFVYHQSVKIGYGKNNLQNDYLTFHVANKKSTFMHIQNHPGSHVVILDDHPSKEVLEYASMLALHLAGQEDGDVQYTTISKLEKLSKRGLVKLKQYQSIHISKVNKDLFR